MARGLQVSEEQKDDSVSFFLAEHTKISELEHPEPDHYCDSRLFHLLGYCKDQVFEG